RRLAGDGLLPQAREARARLTQAGCPVPAVEAPVRYARVRDAVAGCVTPPPPPPGAWAHRPGRRLTHKVWGTLVFLALMFLVFQAIFNWARPLMDLITTGQGWLAEAVQSALPAGPFRSLLVDGVIKGVGSVLVFLPQILILFGFIAVLE